MYEHKNEYTEIQIHNMSYHIMETLDWKLFKPTLNLKFPRDRDNDILNSYLKTPNPNIDCLL